MSYAIEEIVHTRPAADPQVNPEPKRGRTDDPRRRPGPRTRAVPETAR